MGLPLITKCPMPLTCCCALQNIHIQCEAAFQNDVHWHPLTVCERKFILGLFQEFMWCDSHPVGHKQCNEMSFQEKV